MNTFERRCVTLARVPATSLALGAACLVICSPWLISEARAGGSEDTPVATAGISQKPQAIHVPREVLNSYVGKYQPIQPPGAPPPPPGLPPIDVAADNDGLWVTFAVKVRELPISAVEFFDPDKPNSRITFTKDANGHVTGFTMTGLDTSLGGPSELKVKRLP